MQTNPLHFVVAFIQPFQLDRVVDAVRRIPNFPGMSVSEARGFGSHAAHPPRAGERSEVHPFEARLRLEVFCRPSEGSALLAALLFGLSTPLAKRLLGEVAPVRLAALLYLGSGIGLTALRLAWPSRGERTVTLSRADIPWLAGALLFGGVLGPVFLMIGLQRTPASR